MVRRVFVVMYFAVVLLRRLKLPYLSKSAAINQIVTRLLLGNGFSLSILNLEPHYACLSVCLVVSSWELPVDEIHG